MRKTGSTHEPKEHRSGRGVRLSFHKPVMRKLRRRNPDANKTKRKETTARPHSRVSGRFGLWYTVTETVSQSLRLRMRVFHLSKCVTCEGGKRVTAAVNTHRRTHTGHTHTQTRGGRTKRDALEVSGVLLGRQRSAPARKSLHFIGSDGRQGRRGRQKCQKYRQRTQGHDGKLGRKLLTFLVHCLSFSFSFSLSFSRSSCPH